MRDVTKRQSKELRKWSKLSYDELHERARRGCHPLMFENYAKDWSGWLLVRFNRERFDKKKQECQAKGEMFIP